jgi:hypothetical protein
MATKSITELFTQDGTFIPGERHPSLDLTQGGSFGFTPNHAHWVSEKAYVRRNLILMVLEAPKFMSLMEKPTHWYAALRAFVETQPTSVEGFEAGLEVKVVEHKAGAGGEVQQDFTNVTRERSNPVFKFESDREGNIIQKMISTWILYGMSDPNTNIPLAITLPRYEQEYGGKHVNWMGPWYSMSFIAFEPNATMSGVVNAWLVTNSWPMESGPISGKRDISNDNEVPQLSFRFTAYTEFNDGVIGFAETLLSAISFKNANPMMTIPFITAPDSNIQATSTGYTTSVKESIAGNPNK